MINMYIDESGSIHQTSEKLNRYFIIGIIIIQVQYFDSSRNCFIQIADVFSNIMYSNLITKGGYQEQLEKLQKDKYILPPFIFPKEKFENKIRKI